MANGSREPCILAVDLGTSGCKTAVVELPGRLRAWAFREIPVDLLPGGGAEQHPEDWWKAFLATAAEALDRSGARDRVVAVCCSTQGESTVAVDENGAVLAPAILWMDMRGAKHVARVAGGFPNVAGYSATKLFRWIRKTGGAPALSGKDPAGHMLFLKFERPELYEKAYRFLNVLDFMNLRLTGRFVATVDSIVTSWVTDNRRPDAIRYDDGLVRLLGVDREKLPEIVPCSEVIGTLRSPVAEELGLSPSTQVVAGAIDTTAAAVGSSAVRDFDAHLYIGTSSWIAAHVPWKKTDPFAGLASIPCALRDRYLMIGLQTTAGGNLAYSKDHLFFGSQEDEAPPEDAYARMDRLAERSPAGARGLRYLPWLYGERTPVDDKRLRAGFLNLSLEHRREDLVRSVFEGVALNTRWMMGSVDGFLKRRVDALTLIGGGARSPVWRRIFADALGVTIRSLRSPMQANALGAAYIAAVGLNLLTFEEVAEQADFEEIREPDPEQRAVYDDAFASFLELHRRLKPYYHRIDSKRGGSDVELPS